MPEINPRIAKVLLRHARDKASERDKQIETLQAKLSKEKDDRREERFIWSIAFIILFNVVAFTVIESWSGPLVLLVFEFLILSVLAKKMGIEEIVQILDRFFEAVVNNVKRE